MTNSIASAKCPSVLSSGNYGMSQNRCTDESKEYIFLKLTDSAYRAIEEYQRNENAKRFQQSGQRAKIQFNGNSGFIHFPTPDDAEGRKFGFSINDVEGSLECIQQTGKELDILGSLSYRVQIQAKDDVYDTTRTKMAIAEETEKSKRIREIKQTDISGRKAVKKSLPVTTTSSSAAAAAATSHHHHSSNNYQQYGGHSSGNSNNSNSNNNSSNSFLSSSTSSSSNHNNNNNRSKLVTTSTLNNPTSPARNGVAGAGGSKLHTNSTNSSRSPNPTMLGASGTICHTGSSSNSNSNSGRVGLSLSSSSLTPPLNTATSLSTTLSGGMTNGYANISTSDSSVKLSQKSLVGARNGLTGSIKGSSAFLGSNSGGGGVVGGQKGTASNNNSKLPDISKRKIRERLIHLLALRPFKKPELYNRLQNEGLRERERNLIPTILKDIATTRDQTYNLRRQMWNDVNENWPFFSEQELAQLKRRKPQNLTPPLSSDAGSSTSGQSPTSTHTGSPPPLALNGMLGGVKRSSAECAYEDGTAPGGGYSSGVPPKKQRISRFNKEANTAVSGAVSSSTYVSRSGAYGGSTLTGTNSSGSGGSTAQQATEMHSGISNNSELSYSVLDNVDEFMSYSRKASSSGGNDQHSNTAAKSQQHAYTNKEKRSSNGSNSSSCSISSTERRTASGSSNSKEFLRNKNSNSNSNSSSSSNHNNNSNYCSSNSPTLAAFSSNFVPETTNKSNSGRNAYQQQQQQSPNSVARSNNNSTSSVIHSPKVQAVSPREHNNTYRSSTNSNISSSSGNGHINSNAYSSFSSTGSGHRGVGSGAVRSTSKAQLYNDTEQHHQQQQPQQLQQQQQQYNNYYQHQTQRNTPPQTSSPYSSATSSQHRQQQQQQQQPLTEGYQQQQQHAQSPSQQIAAAASSYSSASSTSFGEKTRYDFSQYTPIESIEQRRRYKTEFEKDYDEYRELLTCIEGVGKRFSGLAERLENVRQGCPDYDRIKQQIVYEYQRIRNEDKLQRDKQRFDYLHQKLAFIKQLVTDFDKTLTQQQQMLQQQQQNQLQPPQQNVDSNTGNSNVLLDTHHSLATRLSPMVSAGENSNHSPPLMYHQQQHYQQHFVAEAPTTQMQPTASSSSSSHVGAKPTQYQEYNGHQHQQQQQQQQHHDRNNSKHHTHAANSDDSSDSNSNAEDDDEDDEDDDDDDDDDSNSNSNDDDADTTSMYR